MWFINMKSRVKGDFHARFRGNVGVKFPCVTRLAVIVKRQTDNSQLTKIQKNGNIKYTNDTT